MKKVKYLAIVLAMALMVTGFAYARWTDSFSWTATAQTGNFHVDITGAWAWGSNPAPDAENPSHRMYTNASVVSQDAHSVVVTMGNLAPGSVVRVDTVAQNTGTFPAKFDSATVELVDDTTTLDDNYLFNQIMAYGSYLWDQDGTGTAHDEHSGLIGPWKAGRLTDLNANLTAALTGKVLEPGGTLRFDEIPGQPGCLLFGLDPAAGNEYQGKTVKFKITFNFGQFTTDPELNPVPTAR